jgi:hypothetical protein
VVRKDEIDEDPSEADIERFDSAVQKCPECGIDLYDDATVCWKCGHAVSSAPKGLPVWVIVVAVVLALAIFVAIAMY